MWSFLGGSLAGHDIVFFFNFILRRGLNDNCIVG